MEKRKSFVTAITLLVFILTNACVSQQVAIQNTGDMVVRELALSDFNEIEVSHRFDVEIVHGDRYHLTVEAEESLEPYFEIVIRGKTLEIGMKSEYKYNFQNASHRVAVTLPDLRRIEITNKCNVSIQDFNNLGDIEIKVDDFSSLSAVIKANSVRVDISGHSSVNLGGVVQSVTGKVNGLSTLNLSKLDAQELSVVSDQQSEIKE